MRRWPILFTEGETPAIVVLVRRVGLFYRGGCLRIDPPARFLKGEVMDIYEPSRRRSSEAPSAENNGRTAHEGSLVFISEMSMKSCHRQVRYILVDMWQSVLYIHVNICIYIWTFREDPASETLTRGPPAGWFEANYAWSGGADERAAPPPLVTRLHDAVDVVRPSALIGVSSQGGAFAREVRRQLLRPAGARAVVAAVVARGTRQDCGATISLGEEEEERKGRHRRLEGALSRELR